ncbi:hypothetical protein [Actinacidiphila rubida]|nr:hypothetical protein [Actinacidiphila rubida]
MAGVMATVRCLLVWWALLFVLFLVFISTVTEAELGLGAAGALLGAVGADAVRRAEHPGLGGLRALAPAAASFPAALLQETGRLAVAVIRRLRGGQNAGGTVRLSVDPGVSPAAAAALLSASPGACVIDIRPAEGPQKGAELTMHLLDFPVSPVERALPGRRLT